jgi:hypothetical protein
MLSSAVTLIRSVLVQSLPSWEEACLENMKRRWGSRRTFKKLAAVDLARCDLQSDNMALKVRVSIAMQIRKGQLGKR